jgi:hypothetical protein
MIGGPFQPDAAPCAMIATDDGIVLGSDSYQDAGLYGIPRTSKTSQLQLRKNARWIGVEDSVPGFANRAYRDPNTGLVYIGWMSNFTDISSAVAAGTARAGAFIWSDTPSISKSVNPLVTNDGTLVAYIDRSGTYDLLTAQTLAPGSVQPLDTGNMRGGTVTNPSSVAIGPNAVAAASARFGLAVGTGASAQNQNSVAIGYQAGVSSPSSGTNNVHVGSGTYAANNGTAVGTGCAAVSDAIALGNGTSASQSFSENIGPRFRVRKRLAGDAHPAIPAVDEAQDYTIMVNGRLASFHQTRDGRRVQVSNYGTLATVVGINARATGTTALYTVPTGATAVITKIIIRCTAATAVTSPPTLNVGVTAGDQMPSTPLTGFTAVQKSWVFSPSGLGNLVTSTQVLNLGVDTAAVGTTQTIAVDVMGYLL